jgi:tetratricopeptide (TPR) repeat protein
MKKNKSSYFLVSIVIALMIIITSPGTSMAQNSSQDLEQEYSNKANQFIVDKNYEQAAFVLEELLAKNPDLNNETVYRQITHIYDNYLFNFEKALSFYEKYLDQFPEGKFAGTFRERVAYLNERRSEWQALRDFRKIQLEEDNIRIEDSLKEVEAILSKSENALIAPEIHIYLANKYFETAQYQKARMHVEKYIFSFDEVSMSSIDKALALELYSDILIKQHSFGKAIRTLDQVMMLGNPGEQFNYAVKKNSIINQRNMWYGFMLSLLYFISVVILLIPIKFWQYFKLQHYARQLVAPLLLFALVSLGPILILIITGEQEVDLRFFFILLGLAILSLMIIRLLAPLSLKTGRWVYILISCLHMSAASFITYYMIVYTPV